MGTFRGLPPEVLETLGLDPEGDEDEPDEPPGPYELPHRIAEFSPPKEWPVPATIDQAERCRGESRSGGCRRALKKSHDARGKNRSSVARMGATRVGPAAGRNVDSLRCRRDPRGKDLR